MVSIQCSYPRDSIGTRRAPAPFGLLASQHRHGLCVCRAHEISLHLCERTCAASCNAMTDKLSDIFIAEICIVRMTVYGRCVSCFRHKLCISHARQPTILLPIVVKYRGNGHDLNRTRTSFSPSSPRHSNNRFTLSLSYSILVPNPQHFSSPSTLSCSHLLQDSGCFFSSTPIQG